MKRSIEGDDIEIEIKRFRNFSYMLSRVHKQPPVQQSERGLRVGGWGYYTPDVKITGLKLTLQSYITQI